MVAPVRFWDTRKHLWFASFVAICPSGADPMLYPEVDPRPSSEEEQEQEQEGAPSTMLKVPWQCQQHKDLSGLEVGV